MDLSDLEKQSLRVLALLRSGKLKNFDCTTCTEDLQELRNCDLNDSETVVYRNKHLGEICTCPLRLITEQALEFLDRYDYLEKYPSTAPTYEQVSPRFWAYVKFYDGVVAKLREEDMQPKKTDSTDNKETLKKLFNFKSNE